MGLGKTVQVIAFLASMHLSQKRKNKDGGTKSNYGPILIVCPATGKKTNNVPTNGN